MCHEKIDNWSVLISSVSRIYDIILKQVKNYTEETVEQLIWLCILYILSCFIMYYCVMKGRILQFQKEIANPKRVLLVTAHPDDECMFFGPTVLNLVNNADCIVHLLCLSIGANYGMGKVRKNELYKACKVLGIKEENIIIQSHSLLPDSMEERWPIELVSRIILHQIESLQINTVITFDKHGVSNHLNHCSIYYAVASLCMDKLLPEDCKVYVLESTTMIRKYWSFLDLPLSYMSRIRYILSSEQKDILMKAMGEHVSQNVWFRKLFMLFSRYALLNTLVEMNVSDLELDLQVDEDGNET